MKHAFFIAFLCIVLSSSATAQHRWGLSMGPNISTVFSEINDAFKYDNPHLGFHVSGLYDLKISKRFGFQTDFGFTYLGARPDPENDIALTYFMVPVTFNYAPSSWFRIGVGAQGGLLVGDNEEGDTEYYGLDRRQLDAGLQIGFEFMLQDNASILLRQYCSLTADDYTRKFYNGDDEFGNPTFVEETTKIDRNSILSISLRIYFKTISK